MRLSLARSLLAGIALWLLLWAAGDTLARATLPAVGWLVQRLAPELGLLALAPARDGSEQVIRMTVTRARTVVLGQRALAPDERARAQASTPLRHGLLGPLLTLWVLMSVRGLGPARWLLALALALPGAAALAALDPAVVLAGTVWQLLLDALAPGSFSPLAQAADALRNGGRLVLGLAVAAAALRLATAGRAGPAPMVQPGEAHRHERLAPDRQARPVLSGREAGPPAHARRPSLGRHPMDPLVRRDVSVAPTRGASRPPPS